MSTPDDLIDRLTADLEPKRTISPWLGRAMLGATALLTIAVLTGLFGMRADFTGGRPHSVPLMSELVILSAGCAIAAALTAIARPAVGAVRTRSDACPSGRSCRAATATLLDRGRHHRSGAGRAGSIR